MKNKNKKKITAIFMIVLMILTLMPVSMIQAENSNEELEVDTLRGVVKKTFISPIATSIEGSIPISDKEKLKKIGKEAGYPLNGSYHLTNNIDMNGEEWIPVGNNSTATNTSRFTGVFDGQGYVIKNLCITKEYKYVGLFGYASNAKIINVGLEDIYIKSSFLKEINVGGICGYASSTWIDNCYSSGEITGSSYDESTSIASCSFSGGIYGYASGCTIDNCYNMGEVNSIATNSSFAGGIGGYSDFTANDNCNNTGKVLSSAYNSKAGGICGSSISGTTINNCYNTGDMISTATASAHAGGICAASSDVIISKCYNKGKVTVTSTLTTSSNSTYAGGISGFSNKGTVENCYNTGAVTSTTDKASSYAGGVYGQGNTLTIKNCFNTGDVTSTASISSDAYGGGISSYDMNSTISNCYNTGKVMTTTSKISMAGGICASSSGGSSLTTISHCYNVGEVMASSSSENPSFVYAGGIVGFGPGTTTSDCYNKGKVAFSYPFSSAPNASSYVGGIYGYGAGHTNISNCYNAGEVLPVFANAGGICGSRIIINTSSISNCYWDRDINPSIMGVGNSEDTITSYTTLEMKGEENKEKYVGFNFEIDWYFEEGEDDYPILQAFDDIFCLTLNKTKTTMQIGNSETLVASFFLANKVTWSSDNIAVATVNQDGVVTAISVGEAVIKATNEDGFTASCIVSVVASSYAIVLEKVFPTATVGYLAQTPYEVGIKNTGDNDTSTLSISLSGTNPTSFAVNKTEIANIKVGESDSFTVVPDVGLAVGVYTSMITVSGDNGIRAVLYVKFEVTLSTATPTATPKTTAKSTEAPTTTAEPTPTTTAAPTPTAPTTTAEPTATAEPVPTVTAAPTTTAEPTVAASPTINIKPTSATVVTKKQLSKPTKLKLNAKKATWKNVKNNSGYTINIMQGKKIIKTVQIKKGKTSYKIKKKLLKKGKKYKFTIIAKGKGKYKNSKKATSKVVTI